MPGEEKSLQRVFLVSIKEFYKSFFSREEVLVPGEEKSL